MTSAATACASLLRESLDAAGFAARCGGMVMRYRQQLTGVQMNLLDSHDVPRFLTLCGGDQKRYRLAVLFQMTFVGMPTVFYGDELGMTGLKELDYAPPWPGMAVTGRWRNSSAVWRRCGRASLPCDGEISECYAPKAVCSSISGNWMTAR